jgi:putative ABC transport system permease protein
MKGLRNLFRRRTELGDLKAEIRAHLDEKIASLVAAGMPRAEAEQAARRAFGNVTAVEEAGRDVWRMPRVDDFVADVGFAFRFVRRSPVFAAVAVLSLALGIGANLAVFTVINALLLRPLPVDHPGALVVFSRQDADTGRTNSLTFREYTDLRARTSGFVGLLAHSGGDGSLQVGATLVPNAGERIRCARVSSNFFDLLGVGMAAGRGFFSVDDSSADAERSVVLSYDFWQRRFGGASVVGKPVIVFRNVPFTIVGVAARGFRGIEADERTDVWWPVGTVKIMFADRLAGWNVTVMGRLKPGVPLAKARADAQVAHAAMVIDEAAASPSWNDARKRRFLTQRFEVSSGRTGIAEALRAGFTQPLYALMASVAAVLLIACANVGALLLARTTARRRELAVRLALGSGRARIVQQLMTENALLIAIATMGGVALLPLALRTILGYAPAAAAAALDTAPDLRTLAFVVAMAFTMALIVALLPAIRSTRALEGALGAGARGSGGAPRRARVHQVLLGSQVALSVALLVVAGLFVRTLQNLRGLDAGFDRKTVVLVTLNSGAATTAIARKVGPALESIPGVQSATFYANLGLLGGGSAMSDCIIDGTLPGASAEVTCAIMQVGPRFFEATSTPIVAGRAFATGDEPPAAQVAIINETMARQYFGSTSPLGQRIQGKLVVGVARDTKYTSLREPAPRMMYTPVGAGWAVADVRFALHSNRTIAELTGPIKRAIVDAGVTQPVTAIESLGAIADATLARERLLAELASWFGLVALALACIGLYGTMSFAVARRTNEIGTRLALGASRAHIIGGLMIEFGTPVTLGAAAGIAATLAVSRLLSRFLFGLDATDPTTIGAAVLVLGVAAAATAFLPARRASGTDPLIALRAE